MNNSEKQREHFNTISERYISGRSNKNHLAYKNELWNQIFRELEKEQKTFSGKKILEAMSGESEILFRFFERDSNGEYFGFDYSDSMVLSAKAKNGHYAQIFQADILKWKEPVKYDIIILIGGLHHVPDHVSLALKNIVDSLKPGGLFINFEPTHNFFLFRWIRERIYKKNSLFEENSERGFELKDYENLLSENALNTIYKVYNGLVGYVLYYNPDAFPWLNIGTGKIASLFCKLDIFLGKTFLGKIFSFATFTINRKPN